MAKLHGDIVEEVALRLYDAYNPHPEKTIAVSKADCIHQAAKEVRAGLKKEMRRHGREKRAV